MKVFILKKTHTVNGNPNYKLLIPGVSGKIKYLRKHKAPHTYGIQTYNLRASMKNIFPGRDVEIIVDGN